MHKREREELEGLIRSMQRSLARTAYVVVRDRSVAEGIARDALVRLAARWPEVRRHERPEVWVQAVAIEASLRRARRDGRRDGTLEDAGPGAPTWQPEPELWRALGDLPAPQRAALALHDLEQRPLDETAAVLGRSVPGVIQLLGAAHERLARAPVPELVGARSSGNHLGTRLAAAAGTGATDPEQEIRGLLDRGADLRYRRRVLRLVALVALTLLLVARPDGLARSIVPALAEWVGLPPVQQLAEDVGTVVQPEPIAAGRYELEIQRFGRSTAVVRVPNGWGQVDGRTLLSGPVDDPRSRRLEVWAIAVIGRCNGRIVDEGDSVATAADRLSRLGSLPSTGPIATTMAGRQAAFLTLGPASSDEVAHCWPPGQPVLWHAVGPTKLYENHDWTEMVWLVEVEGRILGVSASHGPDVDRAGVDELVAMAESLTFTPTPDA